MAANENIKKISKQAATENGFFNFFKELKAEVRRITWPSKENVKKATATVLTFCLMYTVIVGVLDFSFKSLVRVVFK